MGITYAYRRFYTYAPSEEVSTHSVHGLATGLHKLHQMAENAWSNARGVTEAVAALSCLPSHGGQGGVSSCRGELLRTPSGLRLPRMRQAHEHNWASRTR